MNNTEQHNKLLKSINVDKQEIYYVTQLLVRRSEVVKNLFRADIEEREKLETIEYINYLNDEITKLLAL